MQLGDVELRLLGRNPKLIEAAISAEALNPVPAADI
jgi:hypothetical protein